MGVHIDGFVLGSYVGVGETGCPWACLLTNPCVGHATLLQEAVYHAGIVVPGGPNHKRGSFALTKDGWRVYDFAHWCCKV